MWKTFSISYKITSILQAIVSKRHGKRETRLRSWVGSIIFVELKKIEKTLKQQGQQKYNSTEDNFLKLGFRMASEKLYRSRGVFLLAGQSLKNSNLDLRFSSYSFTLLITSANTSVFSILLVHSVKERLRFSFTDIFTPSWRYENFNFLLMRV